MNITEHISFHGAMGDTIGVTAILENFINEPIEIFTNYPDVFLNNPKVKKNNSPVISPVSFKPCEVYECNIIQHYCNQLGVPYNQKMFPKLYLTDSEILDSKNTIGEIGGKIISVCLKSSADARDVRYESIIPLLVKLKNEGANLILIGDAYIEDAEKIFIKNLSGKTTLRQAFGILKLSDCYLGVDTGVFHAAAAVGIPQFVFFRNNGCSKNAYLNTYFFESDFSCPPNCCLPYRFLCESNIRCMDKIDMEKYFELIRKLIL